MMASRLFGFAGSSSNVANAMKKGIIKAIQNGIIIDKDGRLIIKENI